MTNDMENKLAEAADELIKVVSTASIHDVAITIGSEAVKGLHQLSIQALSVEALLESWKESQDVKTNTIIQSIAFLKEELTCVQGELAIHREKLANVEDKLVTLNERMAAQTRHQTLETAILMFVGGGVSDAWFYVVVRSIVHCVGYYITGLDLFRSRWRLPRDNKTTNSHR